MRRLVVLLCMLAALAMPMVQPVLAQEATPGATSASAAASPGRTDARYVFPFGVDGLNPQLTVSASVSGVCNESSILTTGRPDAWECLGDDDQIYDPCFENPFATPDSPTELACMTSPFSNEVTLFTLEQPLTREKDQEVPAGPSTWAFPWALELAGGERCLLSSEVELVLAGESVHYVCEGGGFVLGVVDRAQPFWTVRFLANGELASTIATIVTAWY